MGTGSTNGNGSEHANGAEAKRIGVYYEHPHWFQPLFDQLDARSAAWEKLDARSHQYSVAEDADRYSLIFNRMSPSAWMRGNGHAIFYTLQYLAHLEAKGARVVNGRRAFTHEISKALQLSLLEGLGLPYPHARVINHASQAPDAAEFVGYPLVVKPNIGGSGAGIQRFDTPEALRRAVEEGRVVLGIDQAGLVQEFIPARGGIITRVEVLGGKYLYAIQIRMDGETYNLCPGDICLNTKGEELARPICPADAPKNRLAVEAYEPPPRIVEEVELIMKTAGIEVGGVEYIVDDRDGRLLYYDINALSNFVADPERVIGFNPYARLADYLIAEARRPARTAQPAAAGVRR
ncbi:MAG TPA: hypothetical protein VEH49_02645 [Methylomirabilota bacterium]|nr:hypothetical protein [Methylomirabilota bacterium]